MPPLRYRRCDAAVALLPPETRQQVANSSNSFSSPFFVFDIRLCCGSVDVDFQRVNLRLKHAILQEHFFAALLQSDQRSTNQIYKSSPRVSDINKKTDWRFIVKHTI